MTTQVKIQNFETEAGKVRLITQQFNETSKEWERTGTSYTLDPEGVINLYVWDGHRYIIEEVPG